MAGAERLAVPELQLFEHFAAGAAAVVPHPRQPEPLAEPGGPLPLLQMLGHGDRIAVGADRGTHQRQQLRPRGVAPAKQPVGEGVSGVPKQLVGEEPAHPGGGANCR